jgi:hypothetical protein
MNNNKTNRISVKQKLTHEEYDDDYERFEKLKHCRKKKIKAQISTS